MGGCAETYGESEVAGVHSGPVPAGEPKLAAELGVRCLACCCKRCNVGDGVVDACTTSTE